MPAMTTPSTPSWTHYADRRPFLIGRAAHRAGRCGSSSPARDFVEVETPALVPSPGNETHLHAFATDLVAPAGARASGAICAPRPNLPARSFWRPASAGSSSSPARTATASAARCTILNSRCSSGTGQTSATSVLMADCAAILARAAETAGAKRFAFRDRAVDPFARAERLTVAEAFARTPGSISWRCCRRSRRRILPRQRRRRAFAPPTTTLGAIFSAACWSKRSSPVSGMGRPTILYEYPAVQSPLARPKESDPRLAERFELYACGVELANGFGELTDAAEQRRRLEEQMAEKERIYGERYPIDEDFLAALDVMPDGLRDCARVSTGWSCSRPALAASSRCCGCRCPRRDAAA